MANLINWGKTYCYILTNEAFGVDYEYSANAINDLSAPECWDGGLLPLTADSTAYSSDTNILTADMTQI